jgi:DMSO/TMAO reductase YedYZ heme-binding membrane subunit
VIAALPAQVTWYAARASGLVAWAVVTASIVCGFVLALRRVRKPASPAWLLDLHKFLATLALVFIAVHVLALWADNYVYYGPRELFVPMASDYRPGAVAWGLAAMYLLIAIQVTSWARAYLPRRVWHAVHLLSIPMFVTATVHGFTAGADNTNLAVQWLALTGVLLVVFFGGFRWLSTSTRFPRAAPSPRSASTSRRPLAGTAARAEPAAPR